jgi:hypothetical protein
MTKRKKPEDYAKLVDRMTGEAVLALGRGEALRDIIGGIVMVTAQWKSDWDEYDKR